MLTDEMVSDLIKMMQANAKEVSIMDMDEALIDYDVNDDVLVEALDWVHTAQIHITPPTK